MKRDKNGGKIYHIGIMIGNVYTNHPQELLRGIYAAAREYPVTLELFPGTQSSGFYKDLTGNVGGNEFEYQFNTIYDFALYGDLDALIISYGTLCIFLGDKEKEKFFQKYGKIPYVVLEDRVQDENASYIISDNRHGIEQIMEHLITVHGYKKILHISGPLDNTDAAERRTAYLETMKKYQLPVEDKMILYGDYTEYMADEVEALLDANPDAEAICAANDGMAISAYKACSRRGLKVGKDIAITGYDDVSMAPSLNPPLTTIEQNGYDMGYIALQKAFALCMGEDDTPVKLPANFILRQSCGCSEQVIENNWLEADKDVLRWCIPEAADKIARAILLNTKNYRVTEYTKNYLTKMLSYLVEEVYLRENDLDIQVHWKRIQEMMSLIVERHWIEEISVSMVADKLNDLILNLAETESRPAKKQLLMQLMKRINEYILNAYRYHQSTKEIDYSRKAWLEPLHVREMIKHGYHEKEVYLEAVNGMHRQKMKSSYIFLFEEPVIYRQEDEWDCPERLRLAAYHVGKEVCAYEPSERPVITRERGFSTLFSDTGRTYVAFSLFFEQIQYGMLLCEIESEDISSTYVISLQLATGIHFLELNKKERVAQKKLEETMAELEAKNQILHAMSNSDALTGLLNRRGFVEALLKRMREREGERAYILFADLDHLKQINDTFGHGEGDFSIKQIGEILRQKTGKESLAARIGGDEFVAVIFSEDGLNEQDIKAAIKEECSRRNADSEKMFMIECSVGILEFICEPNLEVSDLLQQADSVMYQEKKKRRASVLKKENN